MIDQKFMMEVVELGEEKDTNSRLLKQFNELSL